MKSRVSVNQAVKFHGHLGPYLVLGILLGEAALKKLKAKKYFGIMVKVWGATDKPKSCLIDGLQLATGATYGKGNIENNPGSRIKILARNPENKQEIKMYLKEWLIQKLDSLKGHIKSEQFAKSLYKTNPMKIFELTPMTHDPIWRFQD